jgi:hypothetical protein
VIRIVEDEDAVYHADRLVRRSQRGGALDVEVDVTGDDRLDAVGVAAQLAAAVDLDVEPDVGRGHAIGDDLGAAECLWL